MEIKRWHPQREYTRQEQFLMKRLTRMRKLFGFLREERHALFDDAFLRERVAIEHRLAHITQRQGRRARYLGLRKNLFDLRRNATVLNLETIHRVAAAA